MASKDRDSFLNYVAKQEAPIDNDQNVQPKNLSVRESFLKYASTVEDPPKPIPWWQSIPSSGVKGIVKGLDIIGQSIDPLTDFVSQLTGQPVLKGKQNTAKRAEQIEALESILPSEQGFLEGATERAGKILPMMALGGGSVGGSLLRTLMAGLSGEITKEMGASEMVQSLAEIPALATPAFSRKILPTAAQEPLVQGARALGLTEEAIAPLIQSQTKQTLLKNLAHKRGPAQTALETSREQIGQVYNRLANVAGAQIPMQPKDTIAFINDAQRLLKNMPRSVRGTISGDFQDLINGKMTGRDLMNFWQDINHHVVANPQLGLLKEPITSALRKANPQLAADFSMANELYSSYGKIAQTLSPTLASDLLSASAPLRGIYGVLTGNYPVLLELVGEQAARSYATLALTNPRMQNLSSQITTALNSGRYAAAQQILESFIDTIRDESPDVAAELQKANLTNLEKKIPSNK